MMKDWKKIKLGEIAKVISGFAFKSKDFLKDKGISAIKIKNIKNGNVDLSETDFVDNSFLSINQRYHLNRNDILVSLTGSHMTQPNSVVGRVALYRHDFTSLLNQRAGKVIPNETLIDKKFLYCFLSQDRIKETIAMRANGAANQANVSPGDVEDLDILLPPLETQQKIASILSAYDDLIENNLRRIKLLEEMAAITYKEWFVNFTIEGEKLAIDETTGLPFGWERKNLTEVASVNKNSFKKENIDKIKYVDISSVSSGQIDSYTEYEFNDAPGRARRRVTHGDIIWSCVRPNRKSYSIIWNPPLNLIVSTGFVVITPLNLPTSYLYQYLITDTFVGYLTSMAGGAAYPAVTSSVFENADIIIPKKELIELYDAKVKISIEIIANFQTQNRLLKESRDILLPRLMSGTVVA